MVLPKTGMISSYRFFSAGWRKAIRMKASNSRFYGIPTGGCCREAIRSKASNNRYCNNPTGCIDDNLIALAHLIIWRNVEHRFTS